jgi:hypothetical protein
MNRIRIICLALVAVFAMSAIATASASALPLPEFEGPFPNKFTSTSLVSTLETVGKNKVTCTADTNKGELTGPKTDLVTVTFTGCETSGIKCNSAGGAAGEIKTNQLASLLGYINAATKETGVDLSPAVAGANVAEFECAGIKIVVRGSVIGVITPLNKKTKAYTVKFVQKAGKQKVTKLEGGPKDVLETSINGGAFVESGESTTDKLTLEKATTLKA